jgi:5-methylcytosine-specific restriction protein B
LEKVMGRWTESDREVVDAFIDEWRESCLIEGLSLLQPGEPVWTKDNFEALMEKFVAPEVDDARTFEEKLGEQLAGVAKGSARLMAEVIAIYVAFASPRTIGGQRKSELVSVPLRIIGEGFPEEGVVADAMWGGIGGPGQGFNRRRPFLIKYLVRFGRALVAESEDRRRELVSADADPWKFRDWLDAQLPNPDGAGRTMRNILLHMLFPDAYERIAVDEDKWDIAYAFAGLVDGLDPEKDDVDEMLSAIRERVIELLPDGQPYVDDGIDFYYPPLREGWDAEDTRAPRSAQEGLSPLAALEYKQQVVYYGPPGTGKTFEAKALAERFIRREALHRWGAVHYLQNEQRVRELVRDQVVRRQLHPAYSYEDFIAGLRLDGNTTVPTKGHLLRLIDEINESRETSPDPQPVPWVLILDELNRVDLSRLLGEVFSALDDRDSPIQLSAAGAEDWPPLRLPKDLYIIGTMNLIDQAVEQLDFALRRRFFWLIADYREDLIVPVVGERWEALDLDDQPWLRRHSWDHVEPDIELLAGRATELNEAIEGEPLLGPQYKVGHTYFFDVAGLIAQWPVLRPKGSWRGHYLWSRTGKPQPPLEDLWAYSLAPLLSEYLAGMASQQREGVLRKLRELFLASVEK